MKEMERISHNLPNPTNSEHEALAASIESAKYVSKEQQPEQP